MSFDTIILAVIAVVYSVVCSVCDIKTKNVPNRILIAGIILILCCRFLLCYPISEQIACLIMAAITGLFYFFIRCITHGRLGRADVCFGLFQGAVLGNNLMAIFVCLMIECVFSAVFFCIIGKKAEKQEIPFIPFMSFGLIISFLIYFVI